MRRHGPAAGRRRAEVLSLASIAAVVLAAGTVLAGCTSVRNDLGTRSSGCYVAIPAALGAVHHRGHLDGVRLVGVGALRAREPALYRAARDRAAPAHQVCLVAFTGTYQATQVTAPIGRPSGRLAVVEVGYPGHDVFGTLIVRRPPLTFGHGHIAPL